MTNKLPEALELATELEKYRPIPGAGYSMSAAAALLRTQHALLERSRDEMKAAQPFMKLRFVRYEEALAALNQHLEPK